MRKKIYIYMIIKAPMSVYTYVTYTRTCTYKNMYLGHSQKLVQICNMDIGKNFSRGVISE